MITRGRSGEVTIRQPGRCLQMTVYLAIACCLWVPGLIGIGVMIWLDRPAGLACLAAAVLAVAWGWIRAMRMDVRFDSSGVTVRNFWRTHRLGWDEVSHFTDGGKDWWALKVVRRNGRPIEATGTTSGAKGIVTTGLLAVLRQVAEHYHVGANLRGCNLVARAAIAAAGNGTHSGRGTTHDADPSEPAGHVDSRAGPQQAAKPELEGSGNRAGAQPPSRAVYSVSLASLACGVGSIGLGITDLIAHRILAGSLEAVGMASGGVAAIVASVTWFGMVAPKSTMGPQAEVVRRICRAGQMLGILGIICLAIGSGHGSAL